EAASGDDDISALGPTDGFISYTLSGSYQISPEAELSGGISYILPGDADVASGGATADFDDNSVIALGLRLGISF
ncbi:MAG: hypothetical protein ACPGID_08625, partial [Rubricella sp.]